MYACVYKWKSVIIICPSIIWWFGEHGVCGIARCVQPQRSIPGRDKWRWWTNAIKRGERTDLGMVVWKKRESDGDSVSTAPIAKVRKDSNGWTRSNGEGKAPRIKECCLAEGKETSGSGKEPSARGEPYKLIAHEKKLTGLARATAGIFAPVVQMTDKRRYLRRLMRITLWPRPV